MQSTAAMMKVRAVVPLSWKTIFQGYGYRSVVEAVETVVPHELFHATEAAYVQSTPIWVSEGLAVWAERQFAPESRDFRFRRRVFGGYGQALSSTSRRTRAILLLRRRPLVGVSLSGVRRGIYPRLLSRPGG